MGSLKIQELEQVLRTGHGASQPELKVVLARLSSELEERLNRAATESQEYFLRAASALAAIRGSANAQVRLDCLFRLSHYFRVTGRTRDLLASGTQMLNLAKLSRNLREKRRALTLLGIGLADQGHVARGIECYARALSIAREMSDELGQAAVWVNTGAALQVSSQYEESILCSRRALEVAGNNPAMRFHRTAALTNIAYACLHLNRISEGIRAAECSLIESPAPVHATDFSSLVTTEQNLAFLLIEARKYGEARQCVARAREYAVRSGNPYAELSALVVSGLCNVASRSVDIGLKELTTALDRSKSVAAIHIDSLMALVKAHDLLDQPDQALVYLGQLRDLVATSRSDRISLDESVTSLDMQLVSHFDRANSRDLQDLQAREAKLKARVAERRLESASFEMLERLAVTADLREEASGAHGYRVGKLASLLAERLGWDQDSCRALEAAARLHDIGKVAVPDRILLNSAELKAAERQVMGAHTLIGVELLAKSNIPQLKMAEEIARFHHEWWDGTGYPSKLAGKRIPIHARIVALADVFDAITHGRPYSNPWPIDRALEQIRSLRGRQFDPDLTDPFLSLVERLRNEHDNLDEFLGRAGRNSPFLLARQKIRQMLAQDQEREPTVEGNHTRH